MRRRSGTCGTWVLVAGRPAFGAASVTSENYLAALGELDAENSTLAARGRAELGSSAEDELVSEISGETFHHPVIDGPGIILGSGVGLEISPEEESQTSAGLEGCCKALLVPRDLGGVVERSASRWPSTGS